MAVSHVEAVLEFLRKNGFSEAESALKVDMIEKSDLGSFDYEKFLFPMVPPPPPVRIPATTNRSEAPRGRDSSRSRSSSASSDDEFVSLGSSTSEICSSEFTNPYGIRSTTPGSSKASSEGLTQFGTARDYQDFDMQNDLFWYDEKDDGSFMTPSFRGPDFLGCPSEDKFIMSSETDKQCENPLDLNHKSEEFHPEIEVDYLDKTCLFDVAPVVHESEIPLIDYYQFDTKNKYEAGLEIDIAVHSHYGCSAPFSDCCTGAGEFYGENPANYNHMRMKENHSNDFLGKLVEDIPHTDIDFIPHKSTNKSFNNSANRGSTDDWVEGSKGSSDQQFKVADKDFLLNGIYNYDVDNGEKVNEEINAPEAAANGDCVSADEILMYDTREDEYEVFDLRIIHRKNRTGFEENKDLPVVLNTVIAGRYYITEYLGSAAFSKVVQAHDLHTGIDVCLKIIKNDKDFFDQSLDEIKLLKLVNKHDPADVHHILRLYDYFYHQEHLFIVCELLRANLYEFQKFNQESGGEAYFTLRRLQVITGQCLDALQYLHRMGIIHCDLKPENILIKSYSRCEIKVIDLGSSCFHTDNLCLYVQSRSYRAPEVILGLPYDQRIDLWSLGCILAELCAGEVLFPNEAIVMILARMIGMLGPFDLEMLERGQEAHKYFTEEFDLYHINEETTQLEYIIPEKSSLERHLRITDTKFINFIRSLLEIDPQRRPTAKEALEHPWLSHIYD
ncbi:hypothetical protein FNV43_RR24535 [Rhamnella rubrinervis]|uniref:Protein kinase domain-containing protein n=1 Tax=Rhamnella rubrinervis TaxID=2594499 RepID=A0A8K0DQQ5_9ROSA|nr:hypothetical protein FNV43_RR24535 [Rhamnella rubrinervis]